MLSPFGRRSASIRLLGSLASGNTGYRTWLLAGSRACASRSRTDSEPTGPWPERASQWSRLLTTCSRYRRKPLDSHASGRSAEADRKATSRQRSTSGMSSGSGRLARRPVRGLGTIALLRAVTYGRELGSVGILLLLMTETGRCGNAPSARGFRDRLSGKHGGATRASGRSTATLLALRTAAAERQSDLDEGPAELDPRVAPC